MPTILRSRRPTRIDEDGVRSTSRTRPDSSCGALLDTCASSWPRTSQVLASASASTSTETSTWLMSSFWTARLKPAQPLTYSVSGCRRSSPTDRLATLKPREHAQREHEVHAGPGRQHAQPPLYRPRLGQHVIDQLEW